MTSKIDEYLYLGDDSDAKRFSIPDEFSVIIDLREWNIDIDFEELRLNTLYKVTSLMDYCWEHRYPTLVHCHGGMDRSPFMMAFYYFFERKWDPEWAYEFVKNHHPKTIVHDDWMTGFVKEVKRVQRSLGKVKK